MFGGDPSLAISPAIGIELFHNFTLLHDDLMDQAPLRRGKPTVYKKWNSNIAILAGDTMFALANRYMLKTSPDVLPEIMDLFNQTAMEVCEGQQLDMNFETQEQVSLEEYMEMIRLKTAVLLAASLRIGALIGGAAKADAEKLYEAGINIGLAFQLMDDLLDAYGSEEKFGKMSGGDIVAGKKTFLYLKTLEGINEKDSFSNLFKMVYPDPAEKIKIVKSFFDKAGVDPSTRSEINNYWEIAIRHIQDLSLSAEATRPLLSYCAGLMEREY